MPFYEYQCASCGHFFEAMQKITDAPLRKCPDCGKSALKKLLSAPVFRLKGSGWYETDFKSDKEAKKNLVEERTEEKKEEKKDEKKETKADEKKPEPKDKAQPKAKAKARPKAKATTRAKSPRKGRR